MRSETWRIFFIIYLLGGLVGLPAAVVAQPADDEAAASRSYEQTVDGIVVRLGLISVREAQKTHGGKMELGKRPRDGKRQHVLINLSDAATGAHLTAAKISADVKNPLDAHQTMTLRSMRHDDITDYGEYFRFDMSGRYLIRVTAWPANANSPIEVEFQHDHVLE